MDKYILDLYRQIMNRLELADTDLLLHFLRLDKQKMWLEKVAVTFNNAGLQIVELEYIDKRTKRRERCIIGIHGVNKANVITPGQYSR